MTRHPVKLLLIDDSVAIQRSLGRFLASIDGVEIVGYAEDVASAQRLIEATHPDIVVLDVTLRGNDNGIDVLHYVRQRLVRTQVMIMSNTDSRKVRDRFLGAGAAAYFDKGSEFLEARDWIALQVQTVGDAAP